MVDRLALKAELVKNGYTQNSMAKALGMTPRTFGVKLKKGSFYLKEAEEMIKILNISYPAHIFFSQKVTR